MATIAKSVTNKKIDQWKTGYILVGNLHDETYSYSNIPISVFETFSQFFVTCLFADLLIVAKIITFSRF